MKIELPLSEAQVFARRFAGALTPFCSRVEIAGSVRRGKKTVGDIEIVCVPNPVLDMFGSPAPLEIDHALNGQDWTLYGDLIMNGSKQKKIILREGIQIDLFIVTPPAQFGWLFLLRTGPAEYSHRMVTHRNSYASNGKRGFMPGYLRSEGGALWSNNHVVKTPEEIDVYNLFGMAFVAPEDRK